MATIIPKSSEPDKKITKWEKISTYIQLGLLIFAVFTMVLSFNTANRANELTERTLDIEDKLSNYPIQVIAYPVFALIEGEYLNGSTSPAYAQGFLNATLIVICPHVTKLTIENTTINQINEFVTWLKVEDNGTIVEDDTILPEFDKQKFDKWNFQFATNSLSRRYSFLSYQNNFTYYATPNVNYINISIAITGSFYLNPKFNFEEINILYPAIDLGKLTVHAKVVDVQDPEKEPIQVQFSTNLFADISLFRD